MVSHRRISENTSFGDTSSPPTIGIIDSLYRPPDTIRDTVNIGRTVDVANNEDTSDDLANDISGHGTKVATILSNICPDATYNFYRIEPEEGPVRDMDVLTTFGMASQDDDVDVINYSVGADHISSDGEDCTPTDQPCRLSNAAKMAVGEGTAVISAAGNRPTFEKMCCPALSERVISVGGSISECRGHERLQPSTPSVRETETKHGYDASNITKSPGAIWVDTNDSIGINYPLCSTEDCSTKETCHNNQYNVKWDGNVEETPNNPNIYAPANFIAKGGVIMTSGTSYSTPIVSGGVANIINKCREDGRELSPGEIKSAVVSTGNELENNNGCIFSMKQVYELLTGCPLQNVPSEVF